MKKHFILSALSCLGLFLVGCDATANLQQFQASSFSTTPKIESIAEIKKEVFESKAFKDQNDIVFRYKLLRPLRETNSSEYPLIVVLGKNPIATSYLMEDTFRGIYPSYVVIPDFSEDFPFSQLLLELRAYLSVDTRSIFLISEKNTTLSALKIAKKLPKFFNTIALIDILHLKLTNLDSISKSNLLLFANNRKKAVVESMKNFEKAILNYGGKTTGVVVDPSQGPIPNQVYDDPEFWSRFLNINL